MRLLLDTHTVIWATDEPTRLRGTAVAAIKDPSNDRLISAATIWEIAIKVGLKKLTISLPFRQWMHQAIGDLVLSLLPITVEYVDSQLGLPYHHGDPFDRLLIAQALTDDLTIVGADGTFDLYGVKRLW